MSIVISASSASAESLITAGVAAVALVFSPSSMLSFVLSTDVPASLMSTTNALPTGAVVTVAFTAVSVPADGILNVTLPVPVVSAVVSSLQAMT
jgi:hypothetical protein